MEKEKCDCDCDHGSKWWKHGKMWRGGGRGHLYGMGIIGALFYFLPHVTNFQEAILGIIKSAFWPALIVFKVLELLKF